MFLTNLCNRRWTRAPANRSPSGQMALTNLDQGPKQARLPALVLITWRQGRFSARPGPSWRVRFDDAPPASIAPETVRYPRRATERVTLFRRHHADRAFSAMPAVLEPISDASCHDGPRVTNRPLSRRQSRRFTHPRQRVSYRRLEAPSADRCSWSAFRRASNPPPSSQFCPCDAASDAASPPRLPCMGRLDPSRSRDSSPPTAAGPAPPIDFCHRYDPRAPRRIGRTPQNTTGGGPPA